MVWSNNRARQFESLRIEDGDVRIEERAAEAHAFDLDLLQGGKIIVRRARNGETLKTLDGVDRKLSSDDLIIADANRPVALAGVMGGFDTMITDKTKNVLIESAWFDPVATLAAAVKPLWISDHLCWTGVLGLNAHDLLPIPLNEDTLVHVVERVRNVQDFLERPLVLENPSSYVTFSGSTMSEWEFLTRMAAEQAYEQAGVGPEDLDLVELHDCFATAELVHYDNLMLCPPGGAAGVAGGLCQEAGEAGGDRKLVPGRPAVLRHPGRPRGPDPGQAGADRRHGCPAHGAGHRKTHRKRAQLPRPDPRHGRTRNQSCGIRQIGQ